MIIGNYNTLKVNRKVDFGFYLIDQQGQEVLLPRRYITPEMKIGTEVTVFVYLDSENRPVATTETPNAVVGCFELLRVKAVNEVGAFMDWGLSAKDLLVPFREQRVKMHPGRSYIVHTYLDSESNRIVASAKLDRFISHNMPQYAPRQQVDVLIIQRTELGYKVIVDDSYWGIIYQNETFCDINIGERHKAFIKQVRTDGKIDVTLSDAEKQRVEHLAERIVQYMKSHRGTMTLNDKSSPADIQRTFSCSKKDFKKAIGHLYKAHIISIGDSIKLC